MHCQELAALLLEDKLAGASLLILANKQDLAGALPVQQIAEVPFLHLLKARAEICLSVGGCIYTS